LEHGDIRIRFNVLHHRLHRLADWPIHHNEAIIFVLYTRYVYLILYNVCVASISLTLLCQHQFCSPIPLRQLSTFLNAFPCSSSLSISSCFVHDTQHAPH
jgi:hypothetical protein